MPAGSSGCRWPGGASRAVATAAALGGSGKPVAFVGDCRGSLLDLLALLVLRDWSW